MLFVYNGIVINMYRFLHESTPLFAAAMMALILSSCGEAVAPPSTHIQVTVLSGSHFSVDAHTFSVQPGADVKIALHIADGYEFSGCDYKDYTLTWENDLTILTLRTVHYPTRLQVETKETAVNEKNLYKIVYDLGDGRSFSEAVPLENHLRANTSIAQGVFREGYTLFGWGTGEGAHIGLGSRVTWEEGLILTAHWLAWTPAEQFTCIEEGETLTLTHCSNVEGALVIPAEINGKRVTTLASGFACGLSGTLLSLPNTIKTVEDGAFQDCSFQAISFFDNIGYLSDESFSGADFRTWYINAAQAPRYQKSGEFVQFADCIDRLILGQGSKKLIFYAGCSMSYGFCSQMADAAFRGEYQVSCIGLLGGGDAAAQMDVITAFLEPGDILVHAPEEGSAYQLMAQRQFNAKTFSMFEGNYDLLQYTDMRVDGVFDMFRLYNATRNTMEPCEYADSPGIYNEYGDYIGVHPDLGRPGSHSDFPYSFLMSALTNESVSALCDRYDAMREKGAEVYFSFAPINADGIAQDEMDHCAVFETFYREKLAERGYLVISSLEDYMFPGTCFFDTDYHLGETTAKLRTERLIFDLKAAIKWQEEP